MGLIKWFQRERTLSALEDKMNLGTTKAFAPVYHAARSLNDRRAGAGMPATSPLDQEAQLIAESTQSYLRMVATIIYNRGITDSKEPIEAFLGRLAVEYAERTEAYRGGTLKPEERLAL